MLDLRAAFDTVDHSILLDCMECEFSIRGKALKWFQSYLQDRAFSVSFANTTSSVVPLKYGLRQGYNLGPMLVSLYCTCACSICRHYDISYQMYADDTHIYLPLKFGNKQSSKSLLVYKVKVWLSKNFLKANVTGCSSIQEVKWWSNILCKSS